MKNCGCIIRNYVYAANLLEHLVNVGQDRAMQIAIAVGLERVGEAALGHFEDGVLDCFEFVLDGRVVFR